MSARSHAIVLKWRNGYIQLHSSEKMRKLKYSFWMVLLYSPPKKRSKYLAKNMVKYKPKKIWSKFWSTPGVAMSRIKQEWAPTLTLTRSLSFHSYHLLIHTDTSVTYTLLIHSYSTSFFCIDTMFILITITIRISSSRSIPLLTRLTLGQAKTSAAPQREVWQDKSRSDTWQAHQSPLLTILTSPTWSLENKKNNTITKNKMME